MRARGGLAKLVDLRWVHIMEFLLHVCDFSKDRFEEQGLQYGGILLIQQIFLRSAQCQAVCVHLWALDRELCPERSKLTLAGSSSFYHHSFTFYARW